MYKTSKIIAVVLVGLLSIETHAIKLTNTTDDHLLYSCGNPANKTVNLQKYELQAHTSIEITETEDYIQIYTTQKPTTLASKYPLKDQKKDLSIVTHPMFVYQFKTTEELAHAEPRKKLSSLITRPMVGGSTIQIPAKNTSNNSEKASEQKIFATTNDHENTEPQGLIEILRNRAQSPGRRKPTRASRKPLKAPNVEDNLVSIDTEEESLPESNSTELSPTNNSLEDSSSTMSLGTNTLNDHVAEIDPVQYSENQASIRASLQEDLTKTSPDTKKKTTYRSYFTKKNVAITLSAVGVLSLAAWWFCKNSRKNR